MSKLQNVHFWMNHPFKSGGKSCYLQVLLTGNKVRLKTDELLILYTWSTRQCPPNPKPMFYCHSSCLDEGYVPYTVGKLPTCNLQLQHTCLLLSRAPGDLNYLVQLCLFRVGTELCRKVDHQEQDWAHLV